MGIMGPLFCFVVKICLLLMCLGVRYLVSNLVRVLNILEMKALSFLFFIMSTLARVLSSIVRDIRGGMVLDSKAGSELDNEKETPDTALEVLLFATSFFSWSTSACRATAAATLELTATGSASLDFLHGQVSSWTG